MSFYLKYRPQTIEELDLDDVRLQLGKILAAENLPHAFLFSGPKGLGKTSAARIIAKAVNCEKPVYRERSRREPCNKCESCKSITAGISLDVIEIDAASNRGIDDIRALRETIKLAPAGLAYKVYIIDEVHMLTAEAFNALLKTLEEPPNHAIFILATTEPQKLPATIISRCVQIKFKQASGKEFSRSLARIIKGEGLDVEPEAIDKISRLAEGSFRDGAKILEQLSLQAKKITSEEVANFITQGREFDLNHWVELICLKDSLEAINLLGKAVEEGIDLRWLLTETLEVLRQFLLAKVGIVGDSETVKLSTGQDLGKEDLVGLINLFHQAAQVKNVIIPQLPIELAIIEWAGDKTQSSKLILRQAQYDAERSRSIKTKSNEEEMKMTNKAYKSGEDEKIENAQSTKTIKTSLEAICQNWDKILRSMRPHNNSIEALLRSTRPAAINGNILTLEVFYRFHKEKLESVRCIGIIEKVLKDLFSEEIKIKCLLGEKKPPPKPDKKQSSVTIQEAEEIFLKNN